MARGSFVKFFWAGARRPVPVFLRMEGRTMGSLISLRAVVSVAIVIFFMSPLPKLAAQTEEKLFDEINQLPEVERHARLVSGAKKEGTATWYVAMNRAFAQD